MNTDRTQYLTQAKHEELRQEIKHLQQQVIPELAKRIDDARQMGDLSENAEYHAAREEMAWTHSRVKKLANILQNVALISEEKKTSQVVEIGSSIVVSVNGKEKTYYIVGAQEADPSSGKISNESPLGEAFLGRRKGENIEIQVPVGKQIYTIVDIM